MLYFVLLVSVCAAEYRGIDAGNGSSLGRSQTDQIRGQQRPPKVTIIRGPSSDYTYNIYRSLSQQPVIVYRERRIYYTIPVPILYHDYGGHDYVHRSLPGIYQPSLGSPPYHINRYHSGPRN